MKGIVLAGGLGTRLYPLTQVLSKQLLPVYDKPMVYYPLSVLLLANIRDIALISTPRDLLLYKELLGDGSSYGIQLTYIEQAEPKGLAQAFILAEEFIAGEQVALILGDNIFYGATFTQILQQAITQLQGATIFGYRVSDPQRYGVAEVAPDGTVRSLEEKPQTPRSNLAVTGLYFYDAQVCELARTLRPSARGELEITDLNNLYLAKQRLRLVELPRGMAWLDTGQPESLLEAANFIHTVQVRQGLQIACLEEIAFHRGYITEEILKARIQQLGSGSYSQYLKKLLEQQ